MRCHHHLGQLEQGAVRARFGGEHIDTRGTHVSVAHGFGQCFLVEEATARGVDDDDTRLGLGQGVPAYHSRRLRGLRQMYRDEVGAGQQVVEGHQLDTQLRRPGV